MYSKIISCGVLGIDGYIVEIETDISNGLPAFDIRGWETRPSGGT